MARTNKIPAQYSRCNDEITQRKIQKWGSKVIAQLAQDLKSEFGTMKGFSSTNLKYMACFYENYSELLLVKEEELISHHPGDQLKTCHFINDNLAIFLNIPWRHNVEIMTKVESHKERLWYANQTSKNEWNRNILILQIQSNLYARQAKKELKTNNFALTLPSQTSDLANEIIKDSYNLEFVDNGTLKERALENALIDEKLKSDLDNNSIGIVLCPHSKSSQETQKILNYITKPIGVSGYELAKNQTELPAELKPIEDLKQLLK